MHCDLKHTVTKLKKRLDNCKKLTIKKKKMKGWSRKEKLEFTAMAVMSVVTLVLLYVISWIIY